MARRVFFSFHYDNDINRSMTVRNSWVTQIKLSLVFAFNEKNICKMRL